MVCLNVSLWLNVNNWSFKVKVCVYVINQIEMKVQTAHAMPSYQNDWFQSVLLGEKMSFNNPSSQPPGVADNSMICAHSALLRPFAGGGSAQWSAGLQNDNVKKSDIQIYARVMTAKCISSLGSLKLLLF